MRSSLKWPIYFTATLIICFMSSGCGNSSSPSASNKKTSKISFSQTTTNELVGVLKLTISIPNGVTVPLSPGHTNATTLETINALNSVVQVTSKSNIDLSKLMATVTYTPATAQLPGSIEILYTKADGFIPDINFLLVQFDITSGFSPSPQEFAISSISVAKIILDDPLTPLVNESGISAEIPVTNIQYTVEII